MNHADHHRRQRSFDRAQRAYDNMSPPEDPRDDMDEPEAEGEMEAAQEEVEALSLAACGDIKIGCLNGAAAECNRPNGHAGWHHDDRTNYGWPPNEKGQP